MGNAEKILIDKVNGLLGQSASDLRMINPVTDQVISTKKQKYYFTLWTCTLPGDYFLIVAQDS